MCLSFASGSRNESMVRKFASSSQCVRTTLWGSGFRIDVYSTSTWNTSVMKLHEKAKQWRLDADLSVQQLADLRGYSPEAIYQFERGIRSDRRKQSEWSWQRYKLCCAAIEQQIKTGKVFTW